MLERKLLEAEPGDPVHTLAQARTSTVILRLNSEHSVSVIRFLINSGLAESSDASPRLLRDIALENATLRHAPLSEANLSGADLSNADLTNADLIHADLSGAFLDKADLSKTNLSNADLSHAYVYRSDLSGAFMYRADLSDAQGINKEKLERQAESLEGATMPNGQKYEEWLKDKNAQAKDEKNE
jgi:uncharacterized protein YjbI with pentapeptide repeats